MRILSWKLWWRYGPWEQRREAIAATLAEIGPDAKEAVPALAAALTSPEVEVRGRAAFALSEIGPAAKSAVADLAKLLKDDDADVRKAAALALGKLQGPQSN